jgi:hypothetical protein
LLAACLVVASASAFAQSQRAGRSEIYLSPVFTDGKSYSFDGGSSASTDTGFGLALGYMYNMSSRVAFGGELAWGDADYRATIQPGAGNTGSAVNYNSSLETWTVRFLGNYYFSDGNTAPYVSGGLGWTTIDTNIPSGLPQNICWWYPWWGSYCSTYVPTKTSTEFTYSAAVGLRHDFGNGFVRGQVGWMWIDFGGSYGTGQFTQYRIDFGTKF